MTEIKWFWKLNTIVMYISVLTTSVWYIINPKDIAMTLGSLEVFSPALVSISGVTIIFTLGRTMINTGRVLERFDNLEDNNRKLEKKVTQIDKKVAIIDTRLKHTEKEVMLIKAHLFS